MRIYAYVNLKIYHLTRESNVLINPPESDKSITKF